jgi:hypothetical protein
MAREIGDRIWANPTPVWGFCESMTGALPPVPFCISKRQRQSRTLPSVKAFPNLFIREAAPFNAQMTLHRQPSAAVCASVHLSGWESPLSLPVPLLPDFNQFLRQGCYLDVDLSWGTLKVLQEGGA